NMEIVLFNSFVTMEKLTVAESLTSSLYLNVISNCNFSFSSFSKAMGLIKYWLPSSPIKKFWYKFRADLEVPGLTEKQDESRSRSMQKTGMFLKKCFSIEY